MSTYPHISTRHNDEIVCLSKAKKWLRMDVEGFDEDDDLIQDAIQAAARRVEDECNLSLGISEYTWNTSGIPCDFRDVKYVKEIVSITVDGEVVSADNYKLVRTGQVYSRIDWIGVSPGRETTIVFRAGFGPGEVPPNLLKAIRVMAAEEYDRRGDGVSEKKTLSDRLMEPYKHGYAG